MFQIILFFIISILTAASAQLCLKEGVSRLGGLNFSLFNIFSLIPNILRNNWLLLGLFLFGISLVLWLFILSKIRLNIAYPIAISVEVSLASLGSWFFFHEYLSIFQVLGIIIVMAGVFLLTTKGK